MQNTNNTPETGTKENLYPNENSENADEAVKEEKHHKTERKKLGICMDHSSAHLIGYTNNPTETKTIESDFTHEIKEEALNKSENIMHNKEQQQQQQFYKKIGESIKGYDEVLLFGPTNAKAELANLLKANHLFDKIEIEVKQTDKMSENQEHAFVNGYFSKK